MAQSPVRLEHVWRGVADKSGSPIGPTTPGSTPVFEASQKAAIMTPGMTPLTVDQFTAVRGGISVKCLGNDQGTQSALRLNGLVPFGVYSLQLILIGPTGPVGMGALSDDVNASIFVADETGEADVSVIHKAGPLSVNGEVSGCWLAGGMDVMQQPMVQVVGNYHFGGDGQGPPGTFVPQFSFTFVRMMRVPNEIRDRDGNQISSSTPPDTPIFEFRQGNAIYAPGSGKNRHQLTLREFLQACGSIYVKCTIQQGTRTAMHLNGMVPGGTYTVWLAKPDPKDITKTLGVGALGKIDGSENHFTADQNGEGDIVGFTPGGNLSTFGTIADCWLTDEPIVQVAGVYHIDGKTHGPVTGPDGTYAAQFAFVFAKMP